MELKDYIKYYINTDAKFRTRYVGYDPGQWTVPLKLTYKRCIVLDEDGSIEKAELILRRLEDMSADEAIELTRLIVYKDEYINVSTYRNNFNDIIVTWGLLTPIERAHDDEYKYNATAERCWGSAQFHYLLRQYFDLFGLIDNNLAIDSKTIKESQ